MALAIAGAGACSANDDVPAPQLSSVQPDHAPAGAVVAISGAHLCQAPENSGSGDDVPICSGGGTVNFGTAPGTAAMWADTMVTAEVPAGIVGQVDLSVSVDGRTSNSIHFTAE